MRLPSIFAYCARGDGNRDRKGTKYRWDILHLTSFTPNLIVILAIGLMLSLPIFAQVAASYDWTGYQSDAYQSTLKAVFNDTDTGTDLDISLAMVYRPFSNGYLYPATNQNWTLSGTVNIFCGSTSLLSFTQVESNHIVDNNASAVTCTNAYNQGTNVLTTTGQFSGSNTTGQQFSGTFTVLSGRSCWRGCVWHAFDVKWSVQP